MVAYVDTRSGRHGCAMWGVGFAGQREARLPMHVSRAQRLPSVTVRRPGESKGVLRKGGGRMSNTRRVVWAFILITLGWTAGAATRPEPEFMIAIDAPAGRTRIECLSGCNLMGARDLPSVGAVPMKAYWHECSGASVQRCKAQVAGWRVEGQ